MIQGRSENRIIRDRDFDAKLIIIFRINNSFVKNVRSFDAAPRGLSEVHQR